MTFPQISFDQWRAQVEKDLAGAAFDKTLVTRLPEGLSVQPLYAQAPNVAVPGMPAKFDLVLEEQSDEGFVTPTQVVTAERTLHLNDPLAADFVEKAKQVGAPDVAGVISTLALHQRGADAADELAFALGVGAAALQRLLDAGVSPDEAARQLAVQVSVGRDTFAELAKLRALRVCWAKLTTLAGAKSARLIVHAVGSKRTLTQRDPWVNMLRGTTQTFAAILGGADIVTPSAFDDALKRSALGARVAMNTGLVLRHESALGAVVDPAAGSYFLDTLTDELAREAWKRFQAIEAAGGIEKARPQLEQRIEKSWTERLAAIAKRKTPLLGVSEFANLDEKLPGAATNIGRRESEQFEALRARADALQPTAILVTVGTVAETRARVGFALNFLGAGGIRAKETATPESSIIAVLCGTDERYATEAAPAAAALKKAGCKHVLIAGRPGTNEAELRAAGVDGFIFMGVDLVDSLTQLLELYA